MPPRKMRLQHESLHSLPDLTYFPLILSRMFYDRRIGAEVDGSCLGEVGWAGQQLVSSSWAGWATVSKDNAESTHR